MADKAIWEYPTLQTAEPTDVILIASQEETFNMTVGTLKDSMGEAASKPPVVRNGYWWTWSAAADDYVNSGTPATGPAAGFGTLAASLDDNASTPRVDLTVSGPDTAKNMSFAFHIPPSAVMGVKGDAESTYRSGNVNITPANIGLGNVNNTIAQTQSDIAIVVEGNKTTHTGGAAVGQYVIVHNSTISGITDGLYTATQAIPQNTAITSAYLAAVDGGGLNELNSKITTQLSMVDLGTMSDMASLITAISTLESSLGSGSTRFVKFITNTITDYWYQWEYHTGIVQKDDASNWTAVFATSVGNTLSIGSTGNYYSSKEENNRVSTLDTSTIEFYGFTLGQAKAITAKPYKRTGIAFGVWSTNMDSQKIIPFSVSIPANATTLTIAEVTLYDIGKVTTGSYDVGIMTWRAS